MDYKHITQPDSKGFQVRIVRNKKEHSRYFAHNLWGSKQKALQGAQSWRDQQLVALGRSDLMHAVGGDVLSNKTTTGIRGVSRSLQYDKRRGTTALVYGVFWQSSGKARNKAFHVGYIEQVTADEDFHAFRTAVQFRREYEICRAAGKAFYPERFKSWRTERVYEHGLAAVLVQEAPDHARLQSGHSSIH